MAILSTLVFGLLSLGSIASAVEGSFSFESHRDVADARSVAALKKRQSGIIDSAIGKSLYWFGYFSVGETGPLRLLIDTGSTDLIINPGLYKPSSHKKPYGTGNFSISYEGVNRAGFGFETINGTTNRDNVTAAGLTVTEQAIGETVSYKYFDVPQLPYPNQGQGIIGFAGPKSSSFNPPSNSWFFNLCKFGSISACRLGLLFGTSGKGLTVVGELASKYLSGELVSVPMIDKQYVVKGDVTLDNHIVLENQTIIMDVGTDNIQAPLAQTRKLYKLLGYKGIVKTGANLFNPSEKVRNEIAFFECDKPPTLGFSFPTKSALKPGEKPKIFNVSKKVWDVYNHGNNNCTSILGGTNALGTDWLLGQPFFAGHYVDFNNDAYTIGYGDLKNASDPQNC